MPLSCCRPDVVPLDKILPDEPLLMMGAGPVPIPQAVAHANSLVINHLGPTMARVIDQVKQMARYVFQSSSPYMLGVAGPGSAAMEMAVCNLVSPGDTVLSVVNGYFSGRMAEMARRAGGNVVEQLVPAGLCAQPDDVERALIAHHPKVLTIVQGETSNTTWNRMLPEICRVAAQHDCLVIVDTVCTLSTMPLEMDNWGVDAVITGGQKGLSSIPGVSLVAFSTRAFEHINNREHAPVQWCLDAKLANGFWNESKYHYTAPTSGILALHEALRLVCAETLEHRFERHLVCSEALQAGIEALGLELLVAKPARLNSVIGIKVPEGVNPDRVRQVMSDKHRVEIAGSFGLSILRIGQMGEQSRAHNLFRTLDALGSSMRECGAKVDVPHGMCELARHLAQRSGAL
ncbi:alanine--glyoxylate aminotransferase family protein [Paraburkholderia sp. UCT31]|uniref:pyridoxal-phosphate-dependent aminotransferase family protein n=1 Tax=Paraburkholderia sp. UCT31 TaxID=2615209 RepID=UPI0016552A18|nr:alanine--glyoxylate aminotransferase family protein [Paraburkholderia sp. UCT31]MBC8742757.1 alanine--glyoxylate aminotransferase family protein [Paraburkholderia sp. UCT31]